MKKKWENKSEEEEEKEARGQEVHLNLPEGCH